MPEVDRAGGSEVLPPEPPINVDHRPPDSNPKWKTALIILGSGLLSVAGGAFSNYLQTRGFVSVGAARIFLGVTWLAIAAVIVIVVMALGGQRKVLTISLGLLVLTCGLGSFEAWAIISSRRVVDSKLADPARLNSRSGFMQYAYTKPRRSVIKAGEPLSFDIHIANGGEFPTRNATTYQWVPIGASSPEGELAARREFDKRVAQKRKDYLARTLSGSDISKGSDSWVTLGTTLTEKQARGLLDGSLRQYVLWWSMWDDPVNADPSSQGCMWLQRPQSTDLAKQELFWHYCTEAPSLLTPQSESSKAVLPYCYLSLKSRSTILADSPEQLVVINPGKETVAATTAIMQNGTGPLFHRTLHPNPNSEFIDKPLAQPVPITLGAMSPGTTDLLYGIAPGSYTFEIGTKPTTLTENLQIIHRNGEWLEVTEVYRGEKLIYATPKPPDQPEISLRINNIRDPIMGIENISSLLLRDPYYKVVLWRLSNRNAQPSEWEVDLHGSWIRGHERLGPIHLAAAIKPPVVVGEEFYGYVIVTCPECADTRVFHVGLRIGVKGWYSALPVGQFPWSTETFVKSEPWAVNDIPLGINENRQQIYDVPLY